MKKEVDLLKVISKLVKTELLPEGVVMKMDGNVYVGTGQDGVSNGND